MNKFLIYRLKKQVDVKQLQIRYTLINQKPSQRKPSSPTKIMLYSMFGFSVKQV